MKITFLFFAIFLINPLFSQPKNWSKTLNNIGTFSSPRLTDLNNDGVMDVILGAGKAEFQYSDSAIVALNGKNGDLLWSQAARDQMFISAGLFDINSDGTDDVIVGGRSSELMALNGKNGKAIWRFDTLKYSLNETKRWFNFYNPQIIDDQNSDGVQDILIANGGDIYVPPHNPNRAAGRLVVLSGADGSLFAEAQMPDNKEIYMSIACQKMVNGDYKIIFGTGGETVGGNLFLGKLSQVLKGDLSEAIKLATCENKGFIAPPVWADINNDKVLDIIVNGVNGSLLTFDGQTLKPIWQQYFDGTEAYSSSTIGQFNNDSIPDIFINYAQGIWPNLTWTKQYMVNGANGAIEFSDSMGYYQTSTAVAADLNNDGRDETILSVNYQKIDSLGRKTFFNTLMAIEFGNKEILQLLEGLPGHNIASTPWLGDLDNDNFLDIIFCHSNNKYHTYVFDGMQVNCLKTTISITKTIKWGSYMGSKYDGIYKN